MFHTPAHKQTNQATKPAQVHINPILTFTIVKRHEPASLVTTNSAHIASVCDEAGVECALVPAAVQTLQTPSSYQVLRDVLRGLGFSDISPEAIEELDDTVRHHSWAYVADGTPYTGNQVRAAYNIVMAQLRAMFAPVEGR